MIIRDPANPDKFLSYEPPKPAHQSTDRPHRHSGAKSIKPQLEIADIFRQYGPEYRDKHKLSLAQHAVVNAIVNCRTDALGGHLHKCRDCDHETPEYNSCRNRHCPKCQWPAAAKWIAARKKELLPAPYFHVVFTLPSQLRLPARYNQRVIYGLLFKAASETLLTLGRDPKHIGGDIGLIAVLHTWGQNMIDHPHVHCIVPGGALSTNGKKWLWPKKSKRRKKFFVHVNVISVLFKKKFMHYLRQANQKGQLKFTGQIEHLGQSDVFQTLVNTLYRLDWVTYCKRPFGGPEQVLNYLGRYTHRVAISNSRLIKVENGRVYFKWKNSKKDGRLEESSLKIDEFIRRFLLHVLPDGLMKIRHYGFLSNRHKKVKLAQCRTILGNVKLDPDAETLDDAEDHQQPAPRVCPKCGSSRMICLGEFKPDRERTRRPP